MATQEKLSPGEVGKILEKPRSEITNEEWERIIEENSYELNQAGINTQRIRSGDVPQERFLKALGLKKERGPGGFGNKIVPIDKSPQATIYQAGQPQKQIPTGRGAAPRTTVPTAAVQSKQNVPTEAILTVSKEEKLAHNVDRGYEMRPILAAYANLAGPYLAEGSSTLAYASQKIKPHEVAIAASLLTQYGVTSANVAELNLGYGDSKKEGELNEKLAKQRLKTILEDVEAGGLGGYYPATGKPQSFKMLNPDQLAALRSPNLSWDTFDGARHQHLGPVGQFLADKTLGLGRKVIGKAAKTQLEKAAAKMATKEVGKKLLTAIAGEALGGPIGQIVLTVLEKLGSYILRQVKKILNDPKELFKLALIPLGIGLLTGSLPLMVAGVAMGGLAVMAGGTVVIGGALAGLGGVFGGALGYFTVSVLIPAIFFFFVIPGFFAVIIFILNASAFMVPPQESSIPGSSHQTIPGAEGIVAFGSCPLTGPKKIDVGGGSYDPTTETGHGSNSYWSSCTYPIPIKRLYPSLCQGPSTNHIKGYNENNICTGSENLCPYFGFAADVDPVGSPISRPVVVPFLCDTGAEDCPPLTWSKIDGWYNCNGANVASPEACVDSKTGLRIAGWGYGYVFRASGNGHTWEIYINHIDPNQTLLSGGTYESGTVIGVKSSETDHIHLELTVDGVPIEPDFLCEGEDTPMP